MKLIRILFLVFVILDFSYGNDFFIGKVKDIKQAGSYTYLLVEDNKKSYWIASEHIESVKNGMTIRYKKELVAKNFKSKILNQLFDEIIFASNLQYKN